jgi:hypothetical protein
MKLLSTLTFAVIALGLISTIKIVNDYTSHGLDFVLVPYIVLFVLLLYVTAQHRSKAAKVSLFISACVTGTMCVSAYAGVAYDTSHSSTEGLIFVFVPMYAVALIPVIYVLVRLILVGLNFFKQV